MKTRGGRDTPRVPRGWPGLGKSLPKSRPEAAKGEDTDGDGFIDAPDPYSRQKV